MFKYVRRKILTRLKELELRGRPLVVDENQTVWQQSIHDKLVECLIETACDYIEWGRHRRDGKVMSRLERAYMFTPDFYASEDPRAWLEAHRTSDEHELILYVLEHYEFMESGVHSDKITYILGALTHDREFNFS